MISFNKKNKAFTLAEVLISLSVVGILSAVLVPAFFTVTPKENKIMLRKTYANISKIVSTMSSDNVIYDPDVLGFTKDSKTGKDFCEKFLTFLNVVDSDSANCDASIEQPATPPMPFATTTDGAQWYFNRSADEPTTDDHFFWKIIVDVNGTKPPNCQRSTLNHCAWIKVDSHTCCDNADIANCPNPDTFVISVNRMGKVIAGNSGYDYSVPNSEQYEIDIISDIFNLQ